MSTVAVLAPLLGGGLIDWVGWRGCFGINLPLGAVAIVFVALVYHNKTSRPDDALSWRMKSRQFDWVGIVLMAGAPVCLLLALQWGGTRFSWSSARIVVLFSISGALLVAFAFRQYRLQDQAILPPRIMRMRSVLAGCWFNSCANSTLSVTEYYISIYFQGVRGYSATESGIHMLPLLLCIAAASLCGGFGVTRLGYYNR